MSQREAETVERLYAALPWSSPEGLDDPAFEHVARECFADDFEWVFARPEGTGLGNSYRGLEGWRQAMGTWLEQWTTWTTTAEQIIDLGDRILVLSRSRGLSVSGLNVDVETAEIHELSDGRITRVVSYPTRAEAVELVERSG